MHPGELSKMALERGEEVPVCTEAPEQDYNVAGMWRVQLRLQAPKHLKARLPEVHLIQWPWTHMPVHGKSDHTIATLTQKAVINCGLKPARRQCRLWGIHGGRVGLTFAGDDPVSFLRQSSLHCRDPLRHGALQLGEDLLLRCLIASHSRQIRHRKARVLCMQFMHIWEFAYSHKCNQATNHKAQFIAWVLRAMRGKCSMPCRRSSACLHADKNERQLPRTRE